MYIFILFLVVLGPHCCTRAFSSCGECGLLFNRRVHIGASHCGGFSCCRAWTPGRMGFSGCSSRALEHSLNSCGAWALLPQGLWDLPRSGIEAPSSISSDRLLASGPPGKSQFGLIFALCLCVHCCQSLGPEATCAIVSCGFMSFKWHHIVGVILHMAVFIGCVSEIYSRWVSNWFCYIAMAVNLFILLPSPEFLIIQM